MKVFESALSSFLGVFLSPRQKSLFSKYLDLLLEWNKKINLTSITDTEEIWFKHFLDSLTCLRVIRPAPLISIVDIGTGAGFPGIPLKIMLPSLSITLVDAALKRVNFLKHIIRILNLKDIQAVHSRVEQLGIDDKYFFQFDIAICRAFTNMERYISMALPLLKNGGLIIAMKGSEGKHELDSIKKITYNDDKKKEITINDFHTDIKFLELPILNLSRTVIFMTLKNEI